MQNSLKDKIWQALTENAHKNRATVQKLQYIAVAAVD